MKKLKENMLYCDYGRENLCFDLFKLNRRFEYIVYKKVVVVEMGEFRFKWGNIGWMREILDFKIFCGSFL